MEIEALMKNLNLGDVLEPPRQIKGGLLHRMYCVNTTKGTYAVKVLNSEIMKRKSALQNMINSEKIAALLAQTVPAVVSLEINGSQIHKLDGIYYMVFPWVEGKSVFSSEITVKHCEIIGDFLGCIHRQNITLEGLEKEYDAINMYDWTNDLQMAEKISPSEKWTVQYKKAVHDIERWNQRVCDVEDILAKHMVISHRDLDPKNVMWNDGQAYIIDWEAAGYVNPYQELLEVINYWTDDGKGNLCKEKFDALLTAYKKHISLDDVDWSAVLDAGFSSMLGWLSYNVKRALGIEISNETERKEGIRQVQVTIEELYNYQKKMKCLKEWLEHVSMNTKWLCR